MATLGIYKLPSGRTVEVELSGPPPRNAPVEGEITPAGPGRVAQKVIEATLDLSESVTSIAEMCDDLLGGFIDVVRQPEEVAIEISAKIGASGNLIVAGGSLEGSIKIGLKYKLTPDREPQK